MCVLKAKRTLKCYAALIICLAFIGCSGDDPGKPENKVDRKMLVAPLLAGLPVENRAVDPEFYLQDGLPRWFLEKISSGYQPCERFSRVSFRKFPVGRHALSVKGSDFNPTGCIAWGAFILGVSPVKVSIWATHEQQVAVDDFDIKISYFDPQQGNENVFQEMVIDESSEMLIDGYAWYRFEGIIPASAQGWADIQVRHNATSNLLINGLIVQDIDMKFFFKAQKQKSLLVKKLTNEMKKSLKHREMVLSQEEELRRPNRQF